MKAADFQAQSFAIRENGQPLWQVNCWMAGKLVVLSPTFNSKGAADAYAAMVNSGRRKPEIARA